VTLEVGIERVLVIPVDFNFLEELEIGDEPPSRTNMGYSVKDLCPIRSWLFQIELITRKTENCEVLTAILGIECIHSKVMGSVTSVGCHVDNKDYLPLVVTEIDFSDEMNVHEGEVINGGIVFGCLVTVHHDNATMSQSEEAA